MNEFRKPYEYEDEDSGGWLLVFTIMLITADLLFAIILTIQGNLALKSIPGARIVFPVISALFMLFIAFTAFVCRRIKKLTVKISKVYLIVRLLYTTAGIMIIYITSLSDKTVLGSGLGQFRTKSDMLIMVLIIPMIYTLCFSAGWFLYFMKSKRCMGLNKVKQGT